MRVGNSPSQLKLSSEPPLPVADDGYTYHFRPGIIAARGKAHSTLRSLKLDTKTTLLVLVGYLREADLMVEECVNDMERAKREWVRRYRELGLTTAVVRRREEGGMEMRETEETRKWFLMRPEFRERWSVRLYLGKSRRLCRRLSRLRTR